MSLLNRELMAAIRRGKPVRNAIRLLCAHIDMLEGLLDDNEIKFRVGVMEVTVDAGPDNKLGTPDDSVTIKRAPRKRKAAPKKKAAAKKKK